VFAPPYPFFKNVWCERETEIGLFPCRVLGWGKSGGGGAVGEEGTGVEALQVTSLSHTLSLTHARPLADPHTHAPSLSNALSHTLAAGVTWEGGGQLGKKGMGD